MSSTSTTTVSLDIVRRWTMIFPESASNIQLNTDAAMYSEKRMSKPPFDSSHDFNHIKRVVAHAARLLKAQRASQTTSKPLDATLIVLGALLHDVFDHKYSKSSDAVDPVMTFLTNSGADQAFSRRVQDVVDYVSYSHEMENPAAVQTFLEHTPELGIVQDADRLDAIGAVGVGRCYTFNGAMECSTFNEAMECSTFNEAMDFGMKNAERHISEKPVNLDKIMKTDTGKAMAEEGTRRVKLFLEWLTEENSLEEISLEEAGAAED